MGYTHQKCAWFDKTVMLYWLNNVLMPWWRRHKGTQELVLILDNCPAHKDIDKDPAFPKKLHVIFLPPNLTSKRQPADQGQIYAMKKRYKFSLLHALLLLMESRVGEGLGVTSRISFLSSSRQARSGRRALLELALGTNLTSSMRWSF